MCLYVQVVCAVQVINIMYGLCVSVQVQCALYMLSVSCMTYVSLCASTVHVVHVINIMYSLLCLYVQVQCAPYMLPISCLVYMSPWN